MKKRRRIVLGITGGIATGKTAVLRELARRGFYTVSSDALAHQCLRKNHPCYRRILKHFGRRLLGQGAKIDRKRLGAIVFANPKERRWLERQIHPWVIRQLKSFIRKHRGWIALDIPLLYEAHLEKLVDATVVVWAPRRAQMDRVKRRDRLSPLAALKRIKSQWPLTKKRNRADYVFNNNQDRGALKRQIQHVLARIRQDVATPSGPFR